MRLIKQSQAPKCVYCGRRLWRIHWEKNMKVCGLGWVIQHRKTQDGPACWNQKLCAKRPRVAPKPKQLELLR